MSEVGVVGPVGTWDQSLFLRFRAAPKGRDPEPGKPPDPRGARRRMLLGELIRINTPLIKRLVSQIQGKPPPAHLQGRIRTGMRLVGAKEIEWEVALNLGRFAAAKAFETFDAEKGSFSGYLLKKVFYELQCEVGRQNMIRVERGAKPMGLQYLESDEELGRLDLEEERDEDAPQIMQLAALEELNGAPLVASTVPPAPEPEPPPPDLRTALDVFLEDVCRFAAARRTPMTVVTGQWHRLARARGEFDAPGALSSALRARGVRPITMRVPWWPAPVKGLAGLWLQSSAEAGSTYAEG